MGKPRCKDCAYLSRDHGTDVCRAHDPEGTEGTHPNNEACWSYRERVTPSGERQERVSHADPHLPLRSL